MTAPGRYCLPLPGTCYCGDCDHYRPLPDARGAHEVVRRKSSRDLWAERANPEDDAA